MFAYQAKASFKIWNNIEPIIDEEVMELLETKQCYISQGKFLRSLNFEI